MKKFLLLFVLISNAFAFPHFYKEIHWKLTPEHDFLYLIENPSHATLKMTIKLFAKTKKSDGTVVDSAAVHLMCGDKEFYISSPLALTVCKTAQDIKFELVSLQSNPSEGKFDIEF